MRRSAILALVSLLAAAALSMVATEVAGAEPALLDGPQPIADGGSPKSIDPAPVTSGAAMLMSACPNPALHGATIRFWLAAAGPADIELFGMTGQRVRTLASRSFETGVHSVAWEGTDEDGHAVTAGTYLLRLRTPNLTLIRKLLISR
jgi:hypothetical protein